MLSDISVICLVLIGIMRGQALGGEYEGSLESEPTTINQLITPDLKMTCVLDRMDRASTETTQFKDIDSIVITKSPGDIEVAKVSKDEEAKALSYFKGAYVKDNLFGSKEPGKQVFLEVTVKHPQEALKGDYTCTVKGLDDDDVDVTMTKDFNVKYTAATNLEKIAQYIHDLETRLDAKDKLQDEALKEDVTLLEEKDKSLEEKDKSLEEKDKSLEEKDKSLEEKDKSLEEKDKSLDRDVNSLKEEDKSLHREDQQIRNYFQQSVDDLVIKSNIQMGRVECHPADHNNEHIIHVTFDKRYRKPPNVFVAPTLIVGKDRYIYDYYVDTTHVSDFDFYLFCYTFRHSKIETMYVGWIAIPSA